MDRIIFLLPCIYFVLSVRGNHKRFFMPVREKQKYFKVREKSGNFLKSQGKSLILAKSVKSLISFLHDFSIHFLVKKTKCILQSKETHQLDTQRLTYVVVLIIGFVEKKTEWIC